MPGLNATFSVSRNIQYLGPSNGLVSTQSSLSDSVPFQITAGTGASQCDLFHSSTRTLAPSASESLDLSGSGIQDPDGVNLAFVKIRAIYVKCAAANTNSLIMGNGSTPFVGGFGAGTHTWTLGPGDVFFATSLAAGWAVTNSTADILKFANSSSGTSVTYDLILCGTSA